MEILEKELLNLKQKLQYQKINLSEYEKEKNACWIL